MAMRNYQSFFLHSFILKVYLQYIEYTVIIYLSLKLTDKDIIPFYIHFDNIYEIDIG